MGFLCVYFFFKETHYFIKDSSTLKHSFKIIFSHQTLVQSLKTLQCFQPNKHPDDYDDDDNDDNNDDDWELP